MPFPEFEAGRKSILFFSRGRGRGHAVPDIAIYREMLALRNDLDVRFVSYGSGAEAFHEAGIPIIDLDLPDSPAIVDISVLAGKLIGWLNPRLIVSHEEFAVLPAAKIFDKPVVLLTDWFLESEGYAMSSLKFADEILFLGAEGVFPEPPPVQGRVRYLGAILRPFAFGKADRARARRELSIPEDATVVSVFPGSWREDRTPLLDAVLGAYDALPDAPKQLLWLAGADRDVVRAAAGPRVGVHVYDTRPDIDRLMGATDVAITKSNRKTVFELQHIGIPTIAVSYGLNAGDDLAIAPLRAVVRLDGRGLTAPILGDAIAQLLADPRVESGLRFCSAAECARQVLANFPD